MKRQYLLFITLLFSQTAPTWGMEIIQEEFQQSNVPTQLNTYRLPIQNPYSIDDLKKLFREDKNKNFKEAGRHLLINISQQEINSDCFEALECLLLYGNESDKVFSRERLFRAILLNKKENKIRAAEILFSLSDLFTSNLFHKDTLDPSYKDMLIGARILAKHLGTNKYGEQQPAKRFEAARRLKTDGGLNNEEDREIIRNVYGLFSAFQNEHQYEAALGLYNENDPETSDSLGAKRAFDTIAQQDDNPYLRLLAAKELLSSTDPDSRRLAVKTLNKIVRESLTVQHNPITIIPHVNILPLANILLVHDTKEAFFEPDYVCTARDYYKMIICNTDLFYFDKLDMCRNLFKKDYYKKYKEQDQNEDKAYIVSQLRIVIKTKPYVPVDCMKILYLYGDENDKSHLRGEMIKAFQNRTYSRQGPDLYLFIKENGTEGDKKSAERSVWNK